MAAAALQSALPRPCSQPSAIAPEVGERVQAVSSPKGAVSTQASKTRWEPGCSPTTSQTSPRVEPSSTSTRAGADAGAASFQLAEDGLSRSMPARLGMRTSRCVVLITPWWSDRACSSGSGCSRTVGRVTGAPRRLDGGERLELR